MKFINLILSFYIIALSCLPCSDAENNIGNKVTSISIEEKSASNEHHDDACSPFCICNCCHTSGFHKTAEYITLAAIKINTENTQIEYIPVLFSNFYTSIWQPPKIC